MVETPETESVPPVKPADRMQRVRVGITGLAAVLLVVLLATAIASGVKRNAADGANAVAPPPLAPTVATPTNTVDPNSEPLAQLGAAPGGKPDQSESHPVKH
jgi:hypothetical protein